VSVSEFAWLAIFMLAGYLPVWFAITTRRRWLRVLLGLVASFYLSIYAAIILLAGSADQIQGETVDDVLFVLAIVCGISALATFILAFIPVKESDAGSSDDMRI
jgi:hypothetical protein